MLGDLFDDLDTGVIILDDAFHIRHLNRTAADWLGPIDGGWAGQPVQSIGSRLPWSEVLDALPALGRGEVLRKAAYDARTDRTWELRCRRLRDAPSHVALVAHDMTETARLHERLHRQEAGTGTDGLLASIAHEVRNPLFAISALVDAMVARGANADPVRYQTLLQREVERLRVLMAALVEYGKPPSTTLRPLAVDIVLREAARACAPLAESRQVVIALGELPAVAVSTDPDRLVRAFVNLIENAIQHAPPGTTVTLEARPVTASQGRMLEVDVRDRGPGLDMNHVERLFTPFYTRRTGGTGLGLAIVQKIVAEHHGQVSAQSEPDGGARICVTLPLDTARPAGARDAA